MTIWWLCVVSALINHCYNAKSETTAFSKNMETRFTAVEKELIQTKIDLMKTQKLLSEQDIKNQQLELKFQKSIEKFDHELQEFKGRLKLTEVKLNEIQNINNDVPRDAVPRVVKPRDIEHVDVAELQTINVVRKPNMPHIPANNKHKDPSQNSAYKKHKDLPHIPPHNKSKASPQIPAHYKHMEVLGQFNTNEHNNSIQMNSRSVKGPRGELILNLVFF